MSFSGVSRVQVVDSIVPHCAIPVFPCAKWKVKVKRAHGSHCGGEKSVKMDVNCLRSAVACQRRAAIAVRNRSTEDMDQVQVYEPFQQQNNNTVDRIVF